MGDDVGVGGGVGEDDSVGDPARMEFGEDGGEGGVEEAAGGGVALRFLIDDGFLVEHGGQVGGEEDG